MDLENARLVIIELTNHVILEMLTNFYNKETQPTYCVVKESVALEMISRCKATRIVERDPRFKTKNSGKNFLKAH